MNRNQKLFQGLLALFAILVLSSCSLGQATNPTATPVDVNAVMTSAAATAFVQLTQIAGQASATLPPTNTPAVAPTQAATAGAPSGPTATVGAGGLQLLTPTEGAGGLPAAPTNAAAGTSAVPSLATLPPGGAAVPSLTPFAPTLPASGANVVTCLNSKFAGDITIPDGTVMVPYQKFTKVWAVQNTGTCAWDQGFGYNVWAGPNLSGLGGTFSGHDQAVQPGGTFDVVVEMHAPSQKGEYVSHWKMFDDQGHPFGADFTVYIIVK